MVDESITESITMKTKSLIFLFLFTIHCETSSKITNSNPQKNIETAESKQENSVLQQTASSIDGKEFIPLDIQSIYIHNFDNRSYDSDAVSRLKEKLQNSFNADGRLAIESSKEKADLWLYGSIDRLIKAPATFDQFRTPTKFLYTMVVTLKLRINPRLREEELLNNKIVRYDTSYSPRQPPYETAFSARERLLDTLTARIVYTCKTGWYSDLKRLQELGHDPDGTTTSTNSTNSTAPNSQINNLDERNLNNFIKDVEKQ